MSASSAGCGVGSRQTFLDELPVACDVLRPYQRQQLAEIADTIRSGATRIIAQLATGGGKTHEIASIALAASQAGLRVLILATRTRLVRQLHERLEAFAVPHGVIAAKLPEMLDGFQAVQVAGADTLYRRCLADARMPMPSADVVIFDEAHLAAADSRLKLLEQYPLAQLLGFTATPARRSGRSLGAVFEHLVVGPPIVSLIAVGMLVRMRVFSVPVMTERELTELPKDTANDYQASAAAELMSRPKLVGDVLSNWLRIANGKRTLVFACNKAHGAQLVEQFSRAGIAAELLTDQDDEDVREAAVARLEAGQTAVIVNCFLMSYGVDVPSVECIVLARPTRSLVLYLQMVGRGMRPAPAKQHCLLIDHGRVVETLGLPTLDFGWTLDDRRNVNRDALEAVARKFAEEKPRTCPECRHTWLVSELGNACVHCGWTPAPQPRPVHAAAADLMELDASVHTGFSAYTPEMTQFFREALQWYTDRWPQRWRERPKKGRWWAWLKTRERFEIPEHIRMPSRLWEEPPAPITPEARGWVHSRYVRDCRAWQGAEHARG